MNYIYESLKRYPIISAIKNEEGLKACLESKCEVVFILYGNICTIEEIVDTVKSAKKIAIVHVDLIEGLSNTDVAVQYIASNTLADGIISTKSNMLKSAKERGLMTIQRVFMIDSIAYKNFNIHVNKSQIDFVEILPGIMPKILKKLTSISNVPIIAGGLISDEEDIQLSIDSGAIAVSTTNEDLWNAGKYLIQNQNSK